MLIACVGEEGDFNLKEANSLPDLIFPLYLSLCRKMLDLFYLEWFHLDQIYNPLAQKMGHSALATPLGSVIQTVAFNLGLIQDAVLLLLS